jgi:hypothetical protein
VIDPCKNCCIPYFDPLLDAVEEHPAQRFEVHHQLTLQLDAVDDNHINLVIATERENFLLELAD